MITPRFTTSQNENSILLEIRAPYADLQSFEIDISEKSFMFFCKPYFLRLHLPAEIVEDASAKCAFDADTQNFNCTISKKNKGEFFENLDMITTLLQPKKDKDNNRPVIEVVATENDEENESDPDEWIVEPDLSSQLEQLTLTKHGYGFANKVTDYLDSVEHELLGLFDDKTVFKISQSERKIKRIEFEDANTTDAEFIFVEDEEVDEIINYKCPWSSLKASDIKFTDDENDVLKELPNREYLLSTKEKNNVYLGLIDILYAYCFEKRSFGFESTCESGWGIQKISSTLTWFDIFETPKEALIAAFRRSLIFPLYRNYYLSQRVLKDLQLVLQLGQKFIVQCLIDIYNEFINNAGSEPRYILNELYIKDYIIFVQKLDNSTVEELCKNVSEIVIEKEELELKDLSNNSTYEESESDESSDSDSSSSQSDSDDSDDDSSSDEENINETTKDES